MDSSPRPLLAAGTPKRKHEELSTGNDDVDSNSQQASDHLVLGTDIPSDSSFRPIYPAFGLVVPPVVLADGNRSPPSHMAHRFRSLAIKEDGRDDVAGALRVSATGKGSEDDAGPPKAKRRLIKLTSRKNALPTMSPPSAFSSESDNSGETAVEASLDNDSESSGRSSSPTLSPPSSRIIIDPLRASLTWQDDEITIYDPNDDDDDGTGVNGIGFKPTPAVARARARRRRQQMTDYRRREEREARARRNLQRRSRVVAVGKGLVLEATAAAAATTDTEATAAGLGTVTASAVAKPSSARRVHFLEGPATIRFLEPEAILG